MASRINVSEGPRRKRATCPICLRLFKFYKCDKVFGEGFKCDQCGKEYGFEDNVSL
jgi:hypothetical protein